MEPLAKNLRIQMQCFQYYLIEEYKTIQNLSGYFASVSFSGELLSFYTDRKQIYTEFLQIFAFNELLNLTKPPLRDSPL